MPKPRKRDGVSLKALAGEEAPRLLPVLGEPVPTCGRPLSVWELQELSDWGIPTAHPNLRVAPTGTPGEHSLWRVHRYQVRRLPFLLTYFANDPTAGGSWIPPDRFEPLPTPPPIKRTYKKRNRKRTSTMNEKLTRTEAENDLLLAAQACTALTAQLVEHCEKFAREQGLQRGELGSSLLVAGIEMLVRAGGIGAAQTALRAALQRLAEDQHKAQSVN